MRKPIITAEAAAEMVQTGDTLVIGGSGAGHETGGVVYHRTRSLPID